MTENTIERKIIQFIIVIVTRGIVTYEMSLFSIEKFYKKNT